VNRKQNEEIQVRLRRIEIEKCLEAPRERENLVGQGVVR
jgi:hypothetical protein